MAEDTAERLHPDDAIGVVQISKGFLTLLLVEAPQEVGVTQVSGGEGLDFVVSSDGGLTFGQSVSEQELVALFFGQGGGFDNHPLKGGDAVVVLGAVDFIGPFPVCADVGGGL